MSGTKAIGADARALLAAFAAEIKRRRLEQGLTLAKLSKRAALSSNYIGKVESGDHEPSLSTMLALAHGLGCEPGELFGFQNRSAATLELGRRIDAIESPALRAIVIKLIREAARLAKPRPRRRRAK